MPGYPLSRQHSPPGRGMAVDQVVGLGLGLGLLRGFGDLVPDWFDRGVRCFRGFVERLNLIAYPPRGGVDEILWRMVSFCAAVAVCLVHDSGKDDVDCSCENLGSWRIVQTVVTFRDGEHIIDFSVV